MKRPTTAPSLVAMTTTQVPIVGWERRYMTPRECSRLQSMGEIQYLPKALTRVHRALGNAVNVDVVEKIARSVVLKTGCERKDSKCNRSRETSINLKREKTVVV